MLDSASLLCQHTFMEPIVDDAIEVKAVDLPGAESNTNAERPICLTAPGLRASIRLGSLQRAKQPRWKLLI